LTIPEEVLDGAVSNRFYLVVNPAKSQVKSATTRRRRPGFFDDGGGLLDPRACARSHRVLIEGNAVAAARN